MRRLAAALAVGIVALLTGCTSTRYTVAAEPGRDNSRGPAEATVIIEEWGDFQCPACGNFARQAPQLDASVMADGNTRLIFRNLAFLGLESTWAAQAAECAGDQHRFWDFHDKLFAAQDGENRGAFAPIRLKAFAVDLGLDQSAFNTCVDSNKYAMRVQKETERGSRLGVNSTPTIFVNGQRVGLTSGRSPVESIRFAVQNASSSR
jgi:protein-disulfide isomerase